MWMALKEIQSRKVVKRIGDRSMAGRILVYPGAINSIDPRCILNNAFTRADLISSFFTQLLPYEIIRLRQ